MKVFAVLLLAGGVAASSEELAVEKVAVEHAAFEHHPLMTSSLFKIFGAPAFARDFYLPHEKEGVRAFFAKPFIVAYNDQNEIKSFFLKGGLSSLPSNMEANRFLRSMLLSSPEKVGITLSAMRFLDLPEMTLPLRSLVLPADFNLHAMFRQSQDYPLTPVLFVMRKEALPAASLDKLVEMGEFTVMPDMVRIAREFPVPYFGDLEKSVLDVIQPKPFHTIGDIADSTPVKFIPGDFPITYKKRLSEVPAFSEADKTAKPYHLVPDTWSPVKYIRREHPYATYASPKTVVEVPSFGDEEKTVNPYHIIGDSGEPIKYVRRDQGFPFNKRVLEVVPFGAIPHIPAGYIPIDSRV